MRTTPKITPNAQTVLCKRYLAPDPNDSREPCLHCGNRHETVEEMFDRVSFGNEEYYELMARLDFLPNSPTLFNAGLPGAGTLSACYKFDVQDSMESIMEVARKAALVQKYGGGVGYYLGNLRPKGALVHSTHGKACGPVAVMGLYHSIAEMITQGGKRAGAQMAILPCDHPDVIEFIHCKDEGDALSTFNISVSLTDSFMKQATKDSTSGEAALLHTMAESAWKTGDPGCYFVDTAERANPTPWIGKLTGTNPCGEVPLLDNEPCNLGSINLTSFVIPNLDSLIDVKLPTFLFHFDRLRRVVHTAVRFLDDILGHSQFPDLVIDAAARRTRKLGLGVMGWADTLALLHIPYDSQEALDLGEEIMSLIQKTAHRESVLLGQQKGHFDIEKRAREEYNTAAYPPLCLEVDGKKHRRNATLTCIAPTGSISIIAGVSSGIEPHFALENTRVMGDGTELTEKVAEHPGFRPKTAHEVGWAWHIQHQATFQKYTDLAVSKTINMPETATVKDVYDAYVMAWQEGCKGITIYRDHSRGQQVLETIRESNQVTGGSVGLRRKLPSVRPSITHKFQVGGTEGYAHFGLFDDQTLGELFIVASKVGSTIRGLLDAVAILASLSLQYGVPLSTIVDKMKNQRFDPSGFTANPDIPSATSIVDYVFRWAEKRFLQEKGEEYVVNGMVCPDCGALAISQGGCMMCGGGCGWSVC